MSLRNITLLILALAVPACASDAPVEETPATTASAAPEQPATASPVLADRLAALEPVRTREGQLRFINESLREPGAAEILLERLAAGKDSPEVRRALAEAIGRTGGNYADAVSNLVAGGESDAAVRAALVFSLNRTRREANDDTAPVRRGLAAAIVDPSAEVRAEAAHAIASHPAGASLGAEVVAAIDDEDPQVRAAAIRTAGVLNLSAGLAPARARLQDSSPEVRLAAERALRRLDPELAR